MILLLKDEKSEEVMKLCKKLSNQSQSFRDHLFQDIAVWAQEFPGKTCGSLFNRASLKN